MLNLPSAFLNVANRVSAAVGAPYFDGLILSQTAAVVDDGGSIVTPGQQQQTPCRVQIDGATEYMKAVEGFSDGEVTFIILSASFVGTLNTDANVRVVNGPFAGNWLVSSLSRDPAAIGWAGKGRRA